MNRLRAFKEKLAAVARLSAKKDYDAALAEIDDLRNNWPGSARLHILWANLVQLQERPRRSLDEAKKALEQAIELDKSSPAGAIELGHFLDSVEDNPQAASKAYAEAVTVARKLLIEGLIGQAQTFLQIGKREDALRCLLELLHLVRFEPGDKRHKAAATVSDKIIGALTAPVLPIEPHGAFAEQIKELLSEVAAIRSAS